MKAKEQVVFDIRSEKFRYLMREEHDVKSRVNIDELNKRLNKVKKLNFYANAKMIAFSLCVIIIFALIGLKF
jgi:hypothetical protein